MRYVVHAKGWRSLVPTAPPDFNVQLGVEVKGKEDDNSRAHAITKAQAFVTKQFGYHPSMVFHIRPRARFRLRS